MDFDLGSIAASIKDFFGENGMALGVGAQGLGTALRARSNRKIVAEQQARLNEHRERQRALQAASDARMKQTLAQSTAPAQEADRMSLAEKYRGMMAPVTTADPGDFIPGNPGAPAEVNERAARVIEDSRNKARAYSDASADWASYGGAGVHRGIALGDASRDMNRLLDKSQGWSSVLPAQLEAAKAKGAGYATAADIADGVGGISFLFGATAPKKKPAPRRPDNADAALALGR
jgi:hypothetical protein